MGRLDGLDIDRRGLGVANEIRWPQHVVNRMAALRVFTQPRPDAAI
jgi:hypothetical protein